MCRVCSHHYSREFHEATTEQPIAVKNCLGWTFAGLNQNSTPTDDVYFCLQTSENHGQQLLEDVKTWWNVETYGPRIDPPTEDPTNYDDDKETENDGGYMPENR